MKTSKKLAILGGGLIVAGFLALGYGEFDWATFSLMSAFGALSFSGIYWFANN